VRSIIHQYSMSANNTIEVPATPSFVDPDVKPVSQVFSEFRPSTKRTETIREGEPGRLAKEGA
ncbi:hypothetical protein HK097_006538, partial [Rhizophlyctis rosea]